MNRVFLLYSAIIFVAIIIFFIKYIYTIKKRKFSNRVITYKWFGWYSSMLIMGTSSQLYRKYMLVINRLNTIMWFCLLVGILGLLYENAGQF